MSEEYDVIVTIPVDKYGSSNCEYIKRCQRFHVRYICIPFNASNDFTGLNPEYAIKAQSIYKCL